MLPEGRLDSGIGSLTLRFNTYSGGSNFVFLFFYSLPGVQSHGCEVRRLMGKWPGSPTAMEGAGRCKKEGSFNFDN